MFYFLQFSHHLHLLGDLFPYDGVPNQMVMKVALPITVIYSILAGAGLFFALVCLAFNFSFRKEKWVINLAAVYTTPHDVCIAHWNEGGKEFIFGLSQHTLDKFFLKPSFQNITWTTSINVLQQEPEINPDTLCIYHSPASRNLTANAQSTS